MEGNMDETKHKLEQALEHRPDKQELLDRNILRSDLNPSLQQAALDLEKHQLQDKLQKKLERRPSKEELEARNILQGTHVAPALAAAAVELEPKIAQKQLKHDLAFKEGSSE